MDHPPHTHSHSQILPQESLFHKPEFHSPLTPITKLSSELHQPILGSHSNRMKKKNPPSFRVSHGFKPQFSTYHLYDPRQSIDPKHLLFPGRQEPKQRDQSCTEKAAHPLHIFPNPAEPQLLQEGFSAPSALL